MTGYMQVLPKCKQVVGLRIGLPELLAFHMAVLNKAEKDNFPREAVSWKILETMRELVA